jgi:Cytosine/uracil/thiamine/allantoin permeases
MPVPFPGRSGKVISGLNWRALVAFLVGVTPNLPGLINTVTPSIDVGAGIHPYQFGWLLGFVATTIVYLPLSHWFPAHETQIERAVLPDEIYEERVAVVEGVETDSSHQVQVATKNEKSPNGLASEKNL